MNLANEDIVLLVVAGCFAMPAPGTSAFDEPLVLLSEQPPVPLADSYVGHPGQSSLRWEGQAGCLRTGTDRWPNAPPCGPPM